MILETTYILQVCLLVNVIAATDVERLSCSSHESCRCNGTVLSCFIQNTKFVMPSEVLLNDPNVISIKGTNYSAEIPDKVYNNSWTAIRHLEIIGSINSLTLPFAFTKNMYGLEKLIIKNSNLSYIERYAFRNLSQLVELDLSNNSYLHINEVEKGLQMFTAQTLRLFNISAIHNAEDMREFALTKGLFSAISSIEVLDMSWTRAFKLEASFKLMPNLTSLNISGTLILGPTECFSSINRLSRLETIAIDYWPTFARNSDVTALRYNHYVYRREAVECPITPYVENRTGCVILPVTLKRIYMRYVHSSSFFLSIEKGFCALNNSLELFSVRHMKIFQPVSSINGFHELKLFDISYLGIHFKLNAIMDMPALEIFLSPGNKLKAIENDPNFSTLFTKNKRLKWVDLSENELSSIPSEMFSNNPYLEVIDLSKNILEYININLTVNIHLKKIYLNQNNLKTIDTMILAHINMLANEMTTSVELNLIENDFVCGCNNVDFVKWIQVTKANVPNSTSIVCKDSDIMIKSIMKIEVDKLHSICNQNQKPQKSQSPYFVIYIVVCVAIVVVLSAITSLCLYRRKMCCCHHNMKQPSESPRETVKLEEIKTTDSGDAFVIVDKGLSSKYDRKPQYTVFVAYCHEDGDFVVNKLYSALEQNLREYLPDKHQDTLTLLYDKNFLPGEDLVEICKAAVYNSYVTVAIVSDNFLNSRWCSYEMQTAFEAEVPIVPVYLGKCEYENLSGILKLIYDRKVRLLWPQNTLTSNSLSDNEVALIRCLAISIARYVKKYDSEIANS